MGENCFKQILKNNTNAEIRIEVVEDMDWIYFGKLSDTPTYLGVVEGYENCILVRRSRLDRLVWDDWDPPVQYLNYL